VAEGEGEARGACLHTRVDIIASSSYCDIFTLCAKIDYHYYNYGSFARLKGKKYS